MELVVDCSFPFPTEWHVVSCEQPLLRPAIKFGHFCRPPFNIEIVMQKRVPQIINGKRIVGKQNCLVTNQVCQLCRPTKNGKIVARCTRDLTFSSYIIVLRKKKTRRL